jgi:bifunctional aspartokinase / homoserine dehydrogenase 1
MHETAPSSWIVHKFGGSSVADASCMRQVADVIRSQPEGPLAVVLSASRGVTDALLALIAKAEARDLRYQVGLATLRERHVVMARDLLPDALATAYIEQLDADHADIAGILHTVTLTRFAGEQVTDLVAGYGELWSTRLFHRLAEHTAVRPGRIAWVDARDVLVVHWGPLLGPSVDWDESLVRMERARVAASADTLIIPGFIALDARGVQTTLGRNGSDYSASIFGRLLHAREIQIWTDVDGVLSADPRRVPAAEVIDSLSYDEAMELAYFGAKVLHPQTMGPAVSSGVPIRIRNTFAPAAAGSLISAARNASLPVKGITSIEGIALLNLEGTGMIGVPGAGQRLFGALRDAEISVVLISQASSEHSICCAIREADAERAATAITTAFAGELERNRIERVEVTTGMAILAVVGDGMAGLPGIAGKVFHALGAAGVNVRAIAQGASERNISVVVDGRETTRALRAVHASFYLSPHTLSIGLIGPGTVGRVLMDQLAAEAPRLREQFNLDLRVRGIMGRQRMLLHDVAIAPDAWRDAFLAADRPADLDAFVSHVQTDYLPHTVLIDCTADAGVAAHYADWLRRGIHIVTPNKKANSGPLSSYAALASARRDGGSAYLYEATVGAGLPVIQTLRDLRETGDRITSIEGLLSGTLAYLFNVYNGTVPFSQLVREAKEMGYTEPDPRDDLSGADFARKVIILGREMGLQLEMPDVQVESLVPPALASCSVDEFLDRLPAHDDAMAARYAAATADGKVLRYIGRLTADGQATVGLAALDRTHAFANIALTDNVVRFATERYNNNPLIVQGPGAGPAVTAGGIFADLLRLSANLGARL